MFKNLFKNNKSLVEEVFSPMDGEIVSLSEVPDPAFAQKLIGDGVAIVPKSGKLVSPVNGQVIQVFPTKHAIGIKTKNGIEILIHIGLETVELNGEGFEVLVGNGSTIKIGEPLVNVDLEYLKSKNKEIITPIIITNMDKVLEITPIHNGRETTWGDGLFTCKIK
ncbi:PTS glucose transporter subunit IIA [Bacillus sp. ISL-18]|uniref:PTS sugar transporter subunit IIA n=1 Tax=Bacillus sp. ISL-18 TaxID=2819118 RepID=UPI001BEB0170|nr:PTS glucose transporter subunit IIA [Bacillus sp. ISL-18]MBT2658502.1 PTS glucose transporter subunit IIA [Bacillus sp. ISL-18]